MLNNRQSNRRRGRGRGPSNSGQRDNQSRIDNRARGNAPQLLEKYKNLAREAQLQGDRVMTEYYLQFADHYFRIVAENRARFEETRQQRRDEWQGEEGMEGEAGGEDMSAEGEEARGEVDYRQERQERPRRDNRREFNRNREPRDQNAEGGRNGYAPSTEREPAEEQGLSVDMLPPAIGVTADPIPDLDEAPAPRRRGRARKTEEASAEAEG